MDVLLGSILKIIITISQILTAGIAITAFSLLLYALSFNLKDRVARTFAGILVCLVIIFSADALGSTGETAAEIGFWLRIQWVGIILLPAAYLHFSDALLSTTGQPSRWRRKWAIRIAYLISAGLIILLPTNLFVSEVSVENMKIPINQVTPLQGAFTVYYLVLMALSWFNFIRAYRRTVTRTSRRRMFYLTTSALGPAVGSFPFLLYGSTFANNQPFLFWFIAIGTNVILVVFLVVMAYSVAFFGVPWSDRGVKSRLFKWLLRGPLTASLTLALATIVRRAGDLFGNPYTALVPITTVVSIILCEYAITLAYPRLESWLLFNNDNNEVENLRALEDKLITRSDLRQFLEMILAAVCDRLQVKGAYLLAVTSEGLELDAETGTSKLSDTKLDELTRFVTENPVDRMVTWNGDTLYPLINRENELNPLVEGYIGLNGLRKEEDVTPEDQNALRILGYRASLALKDREAQEQIFRSIELMSPQVDLIQQLRAAGRYNRNGVLLEEDNLKPEEMSHWIKDALTHYWGGPKLSESPLMKLQVVADALAQHENNPTNALRGVLRTAIEQTRPEGERKYTGEWLLYNILDMKFMEGKRVREIALKLSVSEADLYRKQRVAVETIADVIVQMELKALEAKKVH